MKNIYQQFAAAGKELLHRVAVPAALGLALLATTGCATMGPQAQGPHAGPRDRYAEAQRTGKQSPASADEQQAYEAGMNVIKDSSGDFKQGDMKIRVYPAQGTLPLYIVAEYSDKRTAAMREIPLAYSLNMVASSGKEVVAHFWKKTGKFHMGNTIDMSSGKPRRQTLSMKSPEFAEVAEAYNNMLSALGKPVSNLQVKDPAGQTFIVRANAIDENIFNGRVIGSGFEMRVDYVQPPKGNGLHNSLNVLMTVHDYHKGKDSLYSLEFKNPRDQDFPKTLAYPQIADAIENGLRRSYANQSDEKIAGMKDAIATQMAKGLIAFTQVAGAPKPRIIGLPPQGYVIPLQRFFGTPEDAKKQVPVRQIPKKKTKGLQKNNG